MDYSLLPSITDVIQQQQVGQKGLVVPALKAGAHEMLGQVAGFGEAIGRAVGSERLAQGAATRLAEQRLAAEQAGNPAYDNLTSVGGLAYNVLKTLPSLGAMVAGSLAMPEAAVPAWAARLGMAAPEAIGGGRAAMTMARAAADVGDLATAGAAAASAKQAGVNLARTAMGGAAAAYPLSVGGDMQAAHEGGRTPGQGEAFQALALGVPQAAIGAVAPTGIANRWALAAGPAPGVAKRAAAGALAMAPAMGLQSAANTWMTQTMGDPAKSSQERLNEVVQSFLHGAVTGGVIGGALHGVAPPQRPASEFFRPEPPAYDTPEQRIVAADQRAAADIVAGRAGFERPLDLPTDQMEMHDAMGYRPRQVAPARPDDAAEARPVDARPAEGQGDLFDVQPDLVDQLQARQAQENSYRASLVEVLGPSARRDRFFAEFKPTNDVEAYRAVAQRLDADYAAGRTGTKDMLALADHLGLTRDGAPVDFQAEVDAAQAKAEKALALAQAKPKNKGLQTAARNRQATLDEALAARDRYEAAFPEAREAREQAARDAEAARQEAEDQRFATQARQGDLLDTLRARQRDEGVVEDALQRRQRARMDRRNAEDAARTQQRLAVEETFAQTPLGGARLRELGDAELKLRDVMAKGENKRIGRGLQGRVKDALKALDEGDVDELGRLTPAQEEALRLAYKRLGFKATDADMPAPRPRDNLQNQTLRPLDPVEADARRAQVDAELARDPDAPAPVPKVTSDMDMSQPPARPTIGSIARKVAEVSRTVDEQQALDARLLARTPEEHAALTREGVPERQAVDEAAQERAREGIEAAQREVERATAEQAVDLRAAMSERPIPELGDVRTKAQRDAAAQIAHDFFTQMGVRDLAPRWRKPVQKALDTIAEGGKLTDTQKSALINALGDLRAADGPQAALRPFEREQRLGQIADPTPRATRRMEALELTPRARWLDLERTRRATKGQHVWSDDQIALERLITLQGVEYIAVKAGREGAIAVRLRPDSDSILFSPEQMSTLRARMADAQARDAEMAALNPDGPFAGDARVSAMPQVSEHVSAFMARLSRLTGFGGRMLLMTPEEHARLPMQHGRFASAHLKPDGDSYAFVTSLGQGDYVVVLPRNVSKMAQMEFAAHEYGHIFAWEQLAQASSDVHAAIQSDFAAKQQRMLAGTVGELVAETRPDRIGRLAQRNAMADRPARELSTYWMSYDEYVADQFARWAMRKDEAVSVVDRFFQGVGRKLRQIYNALLGDRTRPDASFERFVESVVAGDRGAGGGGGGRRPPRDFSDPGGRRAEARVPDVNIQNGMVDDLLGKVKDAAEAAKALKLEDVAMNARGVRNVTYAFFSMPAIARMLKDRLPQLSSMVDTVRRREAAGDKFAQVNADPVTRVLNHYTSAQRRMMDEALGATAYDVNPALPWEANMAWIEPARRDIAKQVWDQTSQTYQRLKQSTGGDKAFEEIIALNRAQADVSSAVRIADLAREIKNDDFVKSLRNPLESYRTQDRMHRDAVATAAFMRSEAEHNWAALKGYIDAELSDIGGQIAAAEKVSKEAGVAKTAELSARRDAVVPFEQILAEERASLDNAKPYSHLGRQGDYGVSARLMRGADGLVSDATLDAVRDRLTAEGWGDRTIHRLNDQDHVFIRVSTPAEARRLHDTFKDMVAKGLMFENDKHKVRSGEIHSEENQALVASRVGIQMLMAKAKTRRAPAGVDEDFAAGFSEGQAATIAGVMKDWLNSLPSTDVQRLNQKRFTVHGSDANMLQSHIFRTSRELGYLARRAYAGEIHDGMAGAEAHIKNTLKPGGDLDATLSAQAGLREFALRQFRHQPAQGDRLVSALKQGTNTFYLAGSVPFLTQVVTQPFVTVVPELAKTHSFAASYAALARTVPQAARVMKAVAALDNPLASLDRVALKRAGLNAEQVDTLMAMSNRGYIGLSGFAHSIAQEARGATTAKIDTMMRLVGMTGTYGEVASRVMTALAAHDLYTRKHGAKGRQDYVAQILENGMGEMAQHAANRLETNMGAFGRLAMQYTRYPTHLLGRIYEESFKAFSRRASAQEANEARRYLVSHAAAVSMLAGTLGLPGMALFNGLGSIVMNKLTGRDDWDLEGSYRYFLRSTFGDAVGDVIAKGAPRALGVDLSRLLGEDRMVPLTDLLADRRKMEDVMQDWALQTMGAATSTVARVIEGGRDFLEGNYTRAMQKLLPTALRGPHDAYLMSQYGYETPAGAPMPMAAPTGGEIALRAAGLTPTRKAAMSEMTVAKGQLQAARDYRSQMIRENLLRAYQHGDVGAQQTWSAKAMDFQMDHPHLPTMQSIAQALAQRQMQAGEAAALGMPLGVNRRDLGMRQGLAGYGMGIQ